MPTSWYTCQVLLPGLQAPDNYKNLEVVKQTVFSVSYGIGHQKQQDKVGGRIIVPNLTQVKDKPVFLHHVHSNFWSFWP